MSKKLMIIIGGVVVVALAAAVLVMNKKDTKTNTSNQPSSQASNNAENQSSEAETVVEGNLKTLANGSKAQVCDISYSSDDGEGTGKMYTDGKGRGRIQLEITTDRGNKAESNTLLTDGKIYSWTKTEGGAFGFVMSADSVQTNSTGSPTTSNSQTAGKNFSMKCKSWTVEENVVTVPSDVNFSAL